MPENGSTSKAYRTHLPPPVHPSLRYASAPHTTLPPQGTSRVPPLPPRSPRQVPTDAPLNTISQDDQRTAAQLPASMPGSVEAFSLYPDESSSQLDIDVDGTEIEEELTETQLREMYDDEEIDRFLHVFSSYVREVKAPQLYQNSGLQPNEQAGHAAQIDEDQQVLPDEELHIEDESDWVPVGSDEPSEQPPQTDEPMSAGPMEKGLSEWIAFHLVAVLPPPPAPPPPFTLKRMRLTAQRTYLAIEPAYLPLFLRLVKLASWEEPNMSLIYCCLYWILWYHGYLLSCLLLRVLYSMIRRKFLPYPTLSELREHRRRVDRAEEFSVALSMRLAASPAFGVKDMWGVFLDFQVSKKLKKMAKGKAKVVDDPEPVPADSEQTNESGVTEDPSIAAEDNLTVQDKDVAKAALFAVNQIADIHERMKNVFLWRRPASSIQFGLALIALVFVAALPAKYLVKSVGLLIGMSFWHIVPIIAAIPHADRLRFPPPLRDVPTDAEYAMELISQRVARGLDIKPKRRRRQWIYPDNASDEASVEYSSDQSVRDFVSGDVSVNWKKWGERTASTKTWAKDVKNMFKNGQWKNLDNWPPSNPLVPKVVVPYRGSESRVETHTFPAHHNTPGLITLTNTTIFFTPLTSQTAKLSMELKDILGVKKISPMNGLRIRWACTQDEGIVEEREEQFVWIGGRGELFARLVGWEGRRWMKL